MKWVQRGEKKEIFLFIYFHGKCSVFGLIVNDVWFEFLGLLGDEACEEALLLLNLLISRGDGDRIVKNLQYLYRRKMSYSA